MGVLGRAHPLLRSARRRPVPGPPRRLLRSRERGRRLRDVRRGGELLRVRREGRSRRATPANVLRRSFQPVRLVGPLRIPGRVVPGDVLQDNDPRPLVGAGGLGMRPVEDAVLRRRRCLPRSLGRPPLRGAGEGEPRRPARLLPGARRRRCSHEAILPRPILPPNARRAAEARQLYSQRAGRAGLGDRDAGGAGTGRRAASEVVAHPEAQRVRRRNLRAGAGKSRRYAVMIPRSKQAREAVNSDEAVVNFLSLDVSPLLRKHMDFEKGPLEGASHLRPIQSLREATMV
ncbi:hypothetical protein ACHAWF_003937 [Thalassiosira exigua]